MGVLSDLVVAPIEDAQRVADADVPAQTFGGIDIKGIDYVKLGMLHSLLTGRSFEELLPLYDPVVTVSEQGPWVFRLPPDFVARLAALEGAARADAARRWAATKEFALDRWQASQVTSALDGIAALAKKAVASEQALLLWMSL